MDTHENAAMAICQLNGYNVNGRPLKCSVSKHPVYLLYLTLFLLITSQWGKDRPPTGQFDGFSPQQAGAAGFGSAASPYFPQYGGPTGPMTPAGELEIGLSPMQLMLTKLASGPSPAGRGWDQQATNFGGPGIPTQGLGKNCPK
jgi:nucleolysin TIA-1/TIAR